VFSKYLYFSESLHCAYPYLSTVRVFAKCTFAYGNRRYPKKILKEILYRIG